MYLKAFTNNLNLLILKLGKANLIMNWSVTKTPAKVPKKALAPELKTL